LGKSMNEFLADELEKIWATNNLISCKTLKTLNKTIESKLKERTDKPPVILVFKWSQNTIFLEESVKHFLKNKQDEQLLTRQSEFWMNKKTEFLK
jgi:hypothetical protein